MSSPAEGSAPDFHEPVVGWRVWRIFEDSRRYLLMSLHHDVAWPAGAPLLAGCNRSTGGAWLRHSAPGLHCRCGVYATLLEAIDIETLWEFPRSFCPFAIGRVSLWGSVIEAERGWRAQMAYPERLFVPARGWLERRRARQAAQGLRSYRVAVDPLPVRSIYDVVPQLAALYPDSAAMRPRAPFLDAVAARQ